MELIIQSVDHGPFVDSIKSGEVLAIRPDDWLWSPDELTNPNLRIVRAPILGTHAAILLSDHTPPNQRVHGITYPRRGYLIDFSKFPNPAQFSGLRTDAIITLQNAHVLAASKKVP